MRMPLPRVRLRTVMIAVAVVAALLTGGLEYRRLTRLSQPIRVLYLHGPGGSPWEEKFLLRSAGEVKGIQLDLHIVRGAVGTGILAGGYDVYVVHNVPADLLTKGLQQRLVKEVEAGAGVIFLGGRASYGGGGWGRSGLVPLMPTEVDPDPDWMEPETGVRVIPQAGRLSASILESGSNANQGGRIRDGPPPLAGINRLGPLKPSARLLARTDGGQPFLVGQEVGNGRVLAIAGETWPWARQAEQPRAAHRRFWKRVIQWAAHRD